MTANEDQVDFNALDQQLSVDSMSSLEVDGVDVGFNTESDNSSSDSDFHESDYDMEDDDDQVFEINVDLGIERDMSGVNHSLHTAVHTEGVDGVEINEESDYNNSDSLHSVDDSDDVSKKRFSEFNTQTDMENPKLEKGMLFPSRESLKEAVKQYGRKNRYNLKFVRNDKRRVKAICKKECPWVLWGSPFNQKDKMDSTWQIKTHIGEHTCLKEMKNRNVTARWMASHYLHKFSNDHHYSITSLQQDVRTDFNLLVPLSKCYRAKTLALEVVFGNAKEQYARIYDYLQELRQTNEGTTTICLLEARLFLRMYVCLEACKSGFKDGCRPIISLDACFLKGYYGGHLMVAVGIDANDCMYPIAFAAVESENFDSWCWFINLLIQDLEIVNSYHWSFMSDKQKGLVDALMELVPNAEHRNCVRHLYTNFKSQPNTKGKALKDCLWRAAIKRHLYTNFCSWMNFC